MMPELINNVGSLAATKLFRS